MTLKAVIQVLLFALPWRLRRPLLSRGFGYRIAPASSVGFSLLLVDRLVLESDSFTGHLTVLKGLHNVEIGLGGRIGSLNWISGAPFNQSNHFLQEKTRDLSLYIGSKAAITNCHLVDCTDKIVAGVLSIVGGCYTQMLKSFIYFMKSRQLCDPFIIGSYCFIGTRAVLLNGACLPNNSMLAGGFVLSRSMDQEGTMYTGVPALLLRHVEGDYFSRSCGFVS